MADDTALAALVVEMRLNMAKFEDGLNQVTKLTKDTADDVDKSFGSISEGRGGLMLTEEALGVRLPRHLNTLIAQIPGVASAFSAILPIAGVVVAIDIIGKLISKHEEVIKKAQEQREAWGNLTDKIREQADALQLENDKLSKTIAIYSGRSPNLVKVALDEAVVAADKLFNSLKKDVDELETMTDKQHVGVMDQILGSAHGAEEQLRPYFDAIKEVEQASKVAIANAKASGDAKQVEAAQTAAAANVQAAYNKAIDAANGLWNASNAIMKNRANQLMATGEAGRSAMNWVGQDQTDRMTQLGNVVHGLADQMHNAALGADHLKLSLTVGLEDPAKSAVKLRESQEALARSFKEVTDAENREAESAALLSTSGKKQTADTEAQITAIKVAAAQQQYSNDIWAATEHLNIVKSTAGATKAQIETANNALVILAANYQTKVNDEEAAGNNKRFHAQEEADRKATELTRKMAAESLKTDEELSKIRYSAAIADTAFLLKTGQESLNQDTANRRAAEQHRFEDMKAALTREKAAIVGTDAEIFAAQKAADDKLLVEQQKFDAAMKGINQKAEEEKVRMYQEAENKVADAFAKSAAKSIVEGKSMADAFAALGKQMAETALTNLLELETIDGRKKVHDAGVAARGAYTGVMNMDLPPFIGFPLAIASGAAAFAGVMAFDQGGIVPSNQMAMVHQNEMILPPAISQGLQSMISRGGAGGGTNVNMNVHAKDADSFRLSQHQIQADMHRSINIAGRRNT
jgi:hypothetical protein